MQFSTSVSLHCSNGSVVFGAVFLIAPEGWQ
jgi:hypothetical protein